MPFTPPPQNPNFVPGNGARLVVDRFDFEQHLEGTNPPNATNFRHKANQIDLSPTLLIGSTTYTEVQGALAALADIIITGGVPPATIGTNPSNLGAVTLGGDFGGTALIPRLSHLQGFALSLSAPPNTNDVLTWNGIQWTSMASVSTPSGPASGDLSGSYPSPIVSKIDGASVPPAGSLTAGNVLQVSGVSALTYAAVNLANSSSVTGLLSPANMSTITLTGDATGSGSGGSIASTVAALQHNAVQSGILGSTQDGYVLTWNNGASQWQAKLINSGSVILAGDVTGPTSSNTVGKINGSSVPAGGGLTTGNVLQVSGASALTYGALNLASSNSVTGLLPSANMGTIALTGDVTGSATGGSVANTVVAISGTTPIVITPRELQFKSSTSSPIIDQAQAATSTSGTQLTITAQAGGSVGSQVGGILALSSGAGTGGGNSGALKLQVAGGTIGQFTRLGSDFLNLGATSKQVSINSAALGINVATSGSGASWQINGQSAASGSGGNGGDLLITSGTHDGGGTNGALDLQVGGNTKLAISGAGGVNATATANSSFTTSSGALTLTGASDSIWSTTAGSLSIDSSTSLNLGILSASQVNVGGSGSLVAIGGNSSPVHIGLNSGGVTISANTTSSFTTSSGPLTLSAAGALTLTAGAGSIWSTSSGALSIDAGGAGLTLGGLSATAITLGGSGATINCDGLVGATSGTAFAFQQTTGKSIAAGGTFTFTGAILGTPAVELTGTLGSNVTIVLPNAPGFWIFDFTNVVFNAKTVTFQSGSTSLAALSSIGGNVGKAVAIVTFGSNKITMIETTGGG